MAQTRTRRHDRRAGVDPGLGDQRSDRPGAVRLLAELGCDMNRIEQGPPALHLAAYDGNREMVDLLLELGADPTVKDHNFNATPSGWARHAHHDDLADHLRELE